MSFSQPRFYSDLSFKLREDLSTFVEVEFESIFIETTSNEKQAIIGEIYRIPNTNQDMSLNRYNDILVKLQKDNKQVIIGTDQNFDYLKANDDEASANLLNVIIGSGYLPLITKPTRITQSSATLIDNIYTNLRPTIGLTSDILEIDMSDHVPVFLFSYTKKVRDPNNRKSSHTENLIVMLM